MTRENRIRKILWCVWTLLLIAGGSYITYRLFLFIPYLSILPGLITLLEVYKFVSIVKIKNFN